MRMEIDEEMVFWFCIIVSGVLLIREPRYKGSKVLEANAEKSTKLHQTQEKLNGFIHKDQQ